MIVFPKMQKEAEHCPASSFSGMYFDLYLRFVAAWLLYHLGWIFSIGA